MPIFAILKFAGGWLFEMISQLIQWLFKNPLILAAIVAAIVIWYLHSSNTNLKEHISKQDAAIATLSKEVAGQAQTIKEIKEAEAERKKAFDDLAKLQADQEASLTAIFVALSKPKLDHIRKTEGVAGLEAYINKVYDLRLKCIEKKSIDTSYKCEQP